MPHALEQHKQALELLVWQGAAKQWDFSLVSIESRLCESALQSPGEQNLVRAAAFLGRRLLQRLSELLLYTYGRGSSIRSRRFVETFGRAAVHAWLGCSSSSSRRTASGWAALLCCHSSAGGAAEVCGQIFILTLGWHAGWAPAELHRSGGTTRGEGASSRPVATTRGAHSRSCGFHRFALPLGAGAGGPEDASCQRRQPAGSPGNSKDGGAQGHCTHLVNCVVHVAFPALPRPLQC